MDKENIIAGEEKFKNIDNFSFQVGLILTGIISQKFLNLI